MTDELKPCPFCGKPAIKSNELSIKMYAGCGNLMCRAYGFALPEELWQSRPLEDALLAEIERLTFDLTASKHMVDTQKEIITNTEALAQQAIAEIERLRIALGFIETDGDNLAQAIARRALEGGAK